MKNWKPIRLWRKNRSSMLFGCPLSIVRFAFSIAVPLPLPNPA
jgi:hypothetical protein